ncbi:D-xylose 1-dehydrogenase (NADP(+)) [Venturia nashicola]|uniref:D-xylose 1-dehydrogenase (NADP(+)) n=1 Tax=Venturia nashicola TaxID=86259 RepID=A0A4Z1PG74_9PEZI|nr:D-xylose 1-dehydrogenase (NADP(+)) [Venturia nashicola]TLD32264.1 D-xylose 1-dehydrogenase (NADP(+)) [Venturia nashicola]
MAATWSSSTAQPIQGWQQGQYFTSSPFFSHFLHRGKQQPGQSTSYYSETMRGSYQSTQSLETLQFQDELSELMMGDSNGGEMQSIPDPFAPETPHNSFQWSGEASWCGDIVNPSLDGSNLTISDYAMSSLDSTAPSPQEPTSPEACPWRFYQAEPHIRRDSMDEIVPHGFPEAYSQYSNYEISSQPSNMTQGCEDPKANPNHVPDLTSQCQFNTTTFPLGDFRPAWSVSPDVDRPSHDDADSPFHKFRCFPEGTRPVTTARAEQDKLIVEGKRRNMSYKEIKEYYRIDGAVSTLRGRYRAAVKPKNQRVRKPEWKPKDLKLLVYFVNQRIGQGKFRKLKNLQPVDYLYIPWKSVVQDIVNNGGSYHFGPSAAKKRFVDLVAADKAREEAPNRENNSASMQMSLTGSTDPVFEMSRSTQSSNLPYTLRSHSAQDMPSTNDSQTTLQMLLYPMSDGPKSYRSNSQASLLMSSYHGFPNPQSRSDTPFMAVPNSVS